MRPEVQSEDRRPAFSPPSSPCSQPPARTSPGPSPARSHLSGEPELCLLVTKSQAREGREWLTQLKGVGLPSLGVSTLSTSDGRRRSPVRTGLPGTVPPALQHFARGWIQAPVRFLILSVSTLFFHRIAVTHSSRRQGSCQEARCVTHGVQRVFSFWKLLEHYL